MFFKYIMSKIKMNVDREPIKLADFKAEYLHKCCFSGKGNDVEYIHRSDISYAVISTETRKYVILAKKAYVAYEVPIALTGEILNLYLDRNAKGMYLDYMSKNH